MCCGTGKQFKFSISAHTQWLDFRSSSTKWHISSLNIDDLIASKTAIQSFPPVQKLRAQNGHFLTRLKSSPERPKTKRKKRSWFTRKSMQQESCEIWVSQTAKELSYYEYPADSFNGECVANYYRPKKDESYDEKCIKKDQTLAKLPVICNTFGKFYLSSPIPRRSTSLPSWSRTLQRISQPLTSLIELQLNQKDGYWFQRLLQCTNGSCVQKLMLQLCHSEQCIKHIALALVIAEKSFEIPEAAVRHFLSSKRHFKTRLANISGKADLGTWELSLIATLLFTKFYIAIGRERSVRQCLKTGYVLIRSALRNFCYGSTYVDLPGYLPIMAIAFRRLEKAQNDLTT